MSLLNDISRFSAISSVHVFPKMRLMARDHEPDLVVGSGELRVVSANRFEFTLTGEPENPAYVFEQMRRQREDRYDGLSRFRLVLEDDDGTEYAGGWTVPSFRTGDGAWTFEGETDSFLGGGRYEATPTGSTEVRFLIPTRHHAAQLLARFVTTPRDRMPPEPRFDLEVMGQTVTFTFDRAMSILTISTPASESLPLTYTENWLGEPLRILFGQLAFPVSWLVSSQQATPCSPYVPLLLGHGTPTGRPCGSTRTRGGTRPGSPGDADRPGPRALPAIS